MTTTDTKSQVCLGAVPGTTTYTTRGSRKSATERLGSTYAPTLKLPKSLPEQIKTASNSVLVIFKLQKFEPHVQEKPT